MRLNFGCSTECLGKDTLVRMIAGFFRCYFSLVYKDAQQGIIFGEQFPFLFVCHVSTAVTYVYRCVCTIASVEHDNCGFTAERSFAAAFTDNAVMSAE